MADDILERVKKIIVDRLGVDESAIALTSSFKEDLGADSLDVVELVSRIVAMSFCEPRS